MPKQRGGAREGAGRPPADDKAKRVVYVRLTDAEHEVAARKAAAAGYDSIAWYVKSWLTRTDVD